MGDTYDAVIVGARCAGSATDIALARAGWKVLLVDKATFPSDTFRDCFSRLVEPSQMETPERMARWLA